MRAVELIRATHLDRRGLAGLTLLLLAALVYAALLLPLTRQRDDLRGNLAANEHPTAAVAAEPVDTQARLDQFLRNLPTRTSVPQWLGRIRAAAVGSGLALKSVEYKLERSDDSPLLRYRITIPVTGSYGQVRSFIGTVLEEVPAASVDDIQFKRGDGGSRQLDARVRLTLFVAPGAP